MRMFSLVFAEVKFRTRSALCVVVLNVLFFRTVSMRLLVACFQDFQSIVFLALFTLSAQVFVDAPAEVRAISMNARQRFELQCNEIPIHVLSLDVDSARLGFIRASCPYS